MDNEPLWTPIQKLFLAPHQDRNGHTGCVTTRPPKESKSWRCTKRLVGFGLRYVIWMGLLPEGKRIVPRGRLKVPWKEVAQYDATMAGWSRLRAESIDKNESSAMWAALELVIPSEVAELFFTPVDDALVIHDQSAVETLTGQPLSTFQAELAWIVDDGKPCLSPLASLSVVEMACRRIQPRFLIGNGRGGREVGKNPSEAVKLRTGKPGNP